MVTASRSVGRPREFDKDAALTAAMDAFWSKGFEATSMADLCACTGLHKGSIYQTFGDKHSLFMQALQHYSETEFNDVAAQAYLYESPLESVRAVMHKVVEHACDGRGCLMINSLVELAPHNDEVLRFLEDFRDVRMRMMQDLIEKAQAAGEINAQQDSEQLAIRLMVVLAGAATAVKGFMTSEQAHAVVEDAVGTLG